MNEIIEMKDILKDWQKQFPILSRYSSTSLYMKADLVLLGLKLEKVFSTVYRPTLICLPLWEKSKKTIPIFWWELLDNKKLQFDIKYQLHNYLFPAAIECAKIQFGFVFKEEVLLSDLFFYLNKYLSYRLLENDPLILYRLFEFKLAIALYFDDLKLIDNIKIEIEKESKLWEPERFKYLFEKSIEEWKDDLYRKFENRDTFIEQLNQNVSDKKISKLKSAHLLF